MYRVRYEQTIGDLKAAAAKKLGVPVDRLLLFHHGRELTAAQDSRTLLDLSLHTGFGLSGYDLTEPPVFWPPVEETAEGRRVVTAVSDVAA